MLETKANVGIVSDRKRRRETTVESDKVTSPATADKLKKRPKIEEAEPSPIPPTSNPPPEMDAATYKRWKVGITLLLQQLNNDSDASVFSTPVSKRDAPSYYDLVLQPMDLKSIMKRIKDGSISSTSEFRRDMLLIFANAIMFNPPSSDVAASAHRLLGRTEELIHVFEVSLDS